MILDWVSLGSNKVFRQVRLPWQCVSSWRIRCHSPDYQLIKLLTYRKVKIRFEFKTKLNLVN